MNDSPLISIIVPVYNKERYLRQCIESIIIQTHTNYELLLINDGSFDRSGEICDEYAHNDKRLKVFHQLNSGVSSARNWGLKEARGKYVTFIDSDDYVKPQYLEHLLYIVTNNPTVDLVIENVEKIDSNGNIKHYFLPECKLDADHIYRILTDYVDLNIGYSAGKLYTLDIIRRYEIKFLPQVSLAEDLFFLLDYILHTNCIVVHNENDYVYRVGLETSLSNRSIMNFDKEYIVFTSYLMRVRLFQTHFNLKNEMLYKVWKEMTLFFHRALLSLYKNDYPRNDRLNLLSKSLNENFMWVQNCFLPDYKTDKIAKFFLVNKHFYLFDLMMSVLIRIRFKKMFGTK